MFALNLQHKNTAGYKFITLHGNGPQISDEFLTTRTRAFIHIATNKHSLHPHIHRLLPLLLRLRLRLLLLLSLLTSLHLNLRTLHSVGPINKPEGPALGLLRRCSCREIEDQLTTGNVQSFAGNKTDSQASREFLKAIMSSSKLSWQSMRHHKRYFRSGRSVIIENFNVVLTGDCWRDAAKVSIQRTTTGLSRYGRR